MRAANKAAENEASAERAAGERRRKNAAKRARMAAKRQADFMPVVAPVDGPKLERHVNADLVPPAPRGGLLEVFQQPYLLKLIVSRQLAAMYAASLLGLLWSYIQPGLRFGIYYIVFGFVLNLHEGTPYFALHLFSGQVVVHYFGETWSGATRSIWSNKTLVKKMRMPREIFPVAAMVVAAYHTFPQMLVLAIFCLASGWHITWAAVGAGILGFLILGTFTGALALTFSALNVFYRDFQNIVHTFMQFMHFLVPMMYPFSKVWHAAASHPLMYQIYMANPIAQAVILVQQLFWFCLIEDPSGLGREQPPDMWARGFITLGVCVVLLFLAQKFFSRVEGKFPERL
jgi:ABC-2 type transport system permease protein